MEHIINLSIVLGSLGGIAFILYKKIPLLLEFPREGETVSGFVKYRVQKITNFPKVKPERLLNTTLAKTRGLASKTEVQTGKWVEKLQKRTEQHKGDFSESYWGQLRKKTKKK